MVAKKISISLDSSLAAEVAAWEVQKSAVCQVALREAVRKAEGESRKITVATAGGYESFNGKWIIHPDSDDAKTTHLHDEHGEKLNDPEERWGVAISENGMPVYYMPRQGLLRRGPGIAQSTLPEDIKDRVIELSKQPSAEKPPVLHHPDW